MSTFGLSDSDSSYTEMVSPDQLPYLEDMWASAGDMFSMMEPFFNMMFGVGSEDMMNMMNMMMDPLAGQMEGGVYSDMDAMGMYDDAFQNLMNPTTYTQDIYNQIMGGEGNDYVDAMEASIRADAEETLGQSLATLDQRAGLMSGSSGWENAMGDIIGESASNTDQMLAQLGYETFDQNLQQQLEIAQMADTNWLNSATYAMDTASGALDSQNQTIANSMGMSEDMFNMAMSMFMMPMMSTMYYPMMMGEPVVTGSGGSESGGIFGSW